MARIKMFPRSLIVFTVLGRTLASLAVCLVLTNCGYKMGYDGLPAEYRTISVPYVVGDWDGRLTNAIVRQISSSGCFEYKNSQANLTLIVKIDDFSDENIGFRYDRHKDGRLRDTIIPVETRLVAVVDVSVVDACSGKTVLGPVRLSASVDFDHDYYSSRNEVNVFSLGQLSDFDAAMDAAYTPLNDLLAQKIVNYIIDSW